MKPKIAIVRGKFLNKYEMQFYEPLTAEFDITAFGSLTPYHDSFAFPVVKLLSPMDVPDMSLKMPLLNRLFIDAHYLLGLEKYLRGFDIVHSAETYFHFTQQALRAKSRGYVKKVIATVLENIPFNNEGVWGRRGFKKNARENLDYIIALTDITRETLIEEGADARKISVISHFVDTKQFTPSRAVHLPHTLTILFVGRLEVYKGIYDVLNAFYRLLQDKDVKDYKLTLLMVGVGSEHVNIEAFEDKLGVKSQVVHKNVQYDGMPKIYRDADIFVAPSRPTQTWLEQYNTALLEAQASGLPIVTTQTGGIPENIGNAGIVIDPGDIAALHQALKRFILSPGLRQEFAQRARQRAVDVHDISRGAMKLSALYRSIL